MANYVSLIYKQHSNPLRTLSQGICIRQTYPAMTRQFQASPQFAHSILNPQTPLE